MKPRLANLRKLLSKKNLDTVLMSDVYDISYLTGFSNFASEEREAFLLITNNEAFVITDGRYSEAVKKQVKNFMLLERSMRNSLGSILKASAKTCHLKRVGINENNITVAEHQILSRCFNDLNHFSISELRMIKDCDEIRAIKRACEIGDKAFTYIQAQIKQGITEKQLAFELEIFIKQQGADLSFPSIVAFGANASIPHHQTGNTKLAKNSFVLLDFGVKYENYCSDMTRTIFFGKPSEKERKMHQVVLDAQQKATEYIQAKTSFWQATKESVQNLSRDAGSSTSMMIKASRVDKVAREHIVKQNFPSIPHSLGHGIGLEVHEAPSLSPRSKHTLENGMVFSIEPGIYIPNFGGVRIEDLFAIQNNKLVQLTQSSKEFISLMS